MELLPKEGPVRLEGLYLGQHLAELADKLGRPLVITTYVTDRVGVVANRDARNKFQVPPELKNPSDWRLFQELMAQADVVISGSAYLKRAITSGSRAEDILFQFEPGNPFEDLGQWRLEAGYPRRQPDLAFLTHRLNFDFPERLLRSGRKNYLFSSYSVADSEAAKSLAGRGVVSVGAGETGVDGHHLIEYLGKRGNYRVIMMATGPRVLNLLLKAGRMDFIYITEVQREIPFKDPADVQTILPEGKKVGELEEFILTHRFSQQDETAEDGSAISQEFLRYDRKGLSIARD